MQDISPDRLWGMYVMEAVGSFVILMVIQQAHIFEFSAFAISLSFLVAVVIAAKISGAHLNGAVTITLALNSVKTEKVPLQPGEKVYKYIFAQVVGGVCASLVCAMLHGADSLVKIQHASTISLSQAFILEFIYTFILCTVVGILCSDAYKQTHDPTIIGSLVAASVFLASMALGDKTGGVINPSVAISAILSRGITQGNSTEFETLWLYILAPCCAGFISHMLYDKTLRPALLKSFAKKNTITNDGNEILLANMK